MGGMAARDTRRTKYRKPLARYAIRGLLVLAVASGAYLAFLYVPVYWRAWKVQDELEAMSEKIYARRTPESPWHEVVRQIRREAWERSRRILAGHVDAGDMRVSVHLDRAKRRARVAVSWHETVYIKLVKRAYRLNFTKTVLLTVQ